MEEQHVKTAILLLNMGGPESPEEVHPYMKELFQDRELLKLPAQKILGRFIAWRRTPFIQERYEELGQYSPTRKLMEGQGDAIARKLDEQYPESAPHACVPGFRYAVPRTGEMLEKFKHVERVVLFSHYPQHSCSTSGSSLCDAYRWLNGKEYSPNLSVIDRWWDRDDYTELWAELIERKFEAFKKENALEDEDIRIIYSAHSLPEAYCLEKGDKYNEEIEGTISRVEAELKKRGMTNHAHALSWQSKVGPKKTKWLSPSTPEVIHATKEKAILIVPIAFTTDHIETLDEIDIEFREEAEKVVDHFARVDCFNLEEQFIDLCVRLVAEHLGNNCKSEIRPCCVNCVGDDCASMRAFFGSSPIRATS